MKILGELIMLAAVAIFGYIAYTAFMAWLNYKKTTGSITNSLTGGIGGGLGGLTAGLGGLIGAGGALASSFDITPDDSLAGGVSAAQLPNQPYYDSFVTNSANPYSAGMDSTQLASWNFSPQ